MHPSVHIDAAGGKQLGMTLCLPHAWGSFGGLQSSVLILMHQSVHTDAVKQSTNVCFNHTPPTASAY